MPASARLSRLTSGTGCLHARSLPHAPVLSDWCVCPIRSCFPPENKVTLGLAQALLHNELFRIVIVVGSGIKPLGNQPQFCCCQHAFVER
jgi:hypothetical protein